MKNSLILFLLCNICITNAASQSTLFIHAGSVIDVVNGKRLENQLIEINGEYIRSVKPYKDAVIPSTNQVIDLSNATVLPGLIDSHVHLTKSEQLQGFNKYKHSAIRAALFGVYAANKTLEAGFTTVRNLKAKSYGDVALRDAINDGEIKGPRMLVSGPALGITGGHCDENLLPPEFEERSEGVANGPWQVRQKVRENIKYGADVIKFCATGGVTSGTTLGARQFTLEEMQAIVDEAHSLGIKVAAHAHGTEGIKTAIVAGVDSIEHASILDEEAIRLAKEHDTVFVMDIYVSDFILETGEETGMLPESLDNERQIGQLQRDNFRRAYDAGVNMAFGSDAGVYPHGLNARQFAYMVRYGMNEIEAIQSATIHAAELIGWSDQVGVIKPGYYADIIAVVENPLEDIQVLENIRFVMKGGNIYVDTISK